MPQTIIQAKVKFAAGKIFPSKYQDACDRQNILAVLEDGTEEKIYFDAHSPYPCSLRKGDPVTLLCDDRGRLKIAQPQNFQTPAQPTQPQPRQNPAPQQAKPDREAIAAYIQYQAKIFDYCLQQAAPVARKYDLEPGDTRAIATSIYIAAQKKFNL